MCGSRRFLGDIVDTSKKHFLIIFFFLMPLTHELVQFLVQAEVTLHGAKLEFLGISIH
jgi:hypothetical protein